MEMAVTRYIYKGIFRGEMTGSNPTDRGKLVRNKTSCVNRWI